jgi:transposase
VAEISSEISATREHIAELDRRLEELVAENPAARIVRTMPGMGVVFTAEFLAEVGNLGRFASADALAAAGVAPVLRASGATSYRRRARRGNKVLKRVLCTARPSVASPTTSVARPSTGRSEPRAGATTRR